MQVLEQAKEKPRQLAALIGRRPWRAVVMAATAGLIVGAALTGGLWAVPVTVDRSEVRTERDELRAELEEESERADEAEDESAELAEELDQARERIELLGAKGEVPDFTGRSISEARDLAEPFAWEIGVKKQATDKAEPGTVIVQSVAEGKKLARGRSILLTVAQEPPPEWETVASFSGNGGMNTDEFKLPRGKARVVYNFSGDSNTIIELVDPKDSFGGDLLLNEIGARSGSTRVYQPPGTYYFRIEGEGPWSVELQVFR